MGGKNALIAWSFSCEGLRVSTLSSVLALESEEEASGSGSVEERWREPSKTLGLGRGWDDCFSEIEGSDLSRSDMFIKYGSDDECQREMDAKST